MKILSVVEERPLGASLPAEVTTYVGRGSEIQEAKRLLASGPVVTLTGPGGVGKSRLALQVIAAVRGAFRDGAVLVELAQLRAPNLLVSTVADRLGLGDRSTRPAVEMIVDALRMRQQLLVLDNCEHLVDTCAQFVGTLVAACPDLVVLTTSRQSLGVAGERILPVPPLSVPEPGEPPAHLDRYDAVRLFIDRATAVVPSFTVTKDNAEDVTELVRALDGLPLAIELAAVRLRSLSVHQLTSRLNKQFTLLTGGGRRGPSRHETLRAMIDWSHELCTGPERKLWARAAVFAGSFELDAAEEVCSGDGLERHMVLDVIDGLLDKSILLREEHEGVARYRMLETMRQYGEEQLHISGELVSAKRRHRDWILRLTAQFAEEWIGPRQVEWIDRLRREHANLRAAIEFCSTSPEEAVYGLRMAPTFKEYWIIRGLNTESRILLNKLLAAAPANAPERAHALWIYAFFALLQSDIPPVEATLKEAAEVAARNGDQKATAFIYHVRGYQALIGNEMPEAVRLFRTAANMFRDQDDLSGEVWATYNYGLALGLNGELDAGREVLQECVDTCGKHGEVFWRAWAMWSQAAAEYLRGDIQRSYDACIGALRLQRRVGDRVIMAFIFTVLAGCATHTGKLRRAARLLGAATTVWQSLGASPATYSAFVEPLQRDTELVTGALGPEVAGGEFAIGYAMTADAAVAYALEDDVVPEQKRARRPDNPLTKRETQIAQLVAKGMTNREIAQSLVISQRTAETHVDHILTKLGFTNRAQIAAWVVETRQD